MLPLVALLSAIAYCQNAETPEPAPIQFQVLKGQKVDLGNRSIYLNRVVPPILPAAPVKPPQTDVQITQVDANEVLAPQKQSDVLFLSATVYDHSFTEIRWVSGERRWSAFSNIDFNLLAGAGGVETEDTVYSLFLGLGNATTGATESPEGGTPEDQTPAPEQKAFPALDQLSPTLAQYLVVKDEPDVAPLAKDLAALDALHRYYDANKERLAGEYVKREAARIEREQWLKDHPPVAQDTIINFWPIRSTNYRTPPSGSQP